MAETLEINEISFTHAIQMTQDCWFEKLQICKAGNNFEICPEKLLSKIKFDRKFFKLVGNFLVRSE